MRAIVVDARPGASGRSRIEAALGLARHTRGHVRLLVDTPLDRYIVVDGLGGSLLAADALHDAVIADDVFAATIAEQLARGDVCCDVLRADCDPVDALAAAALLADVVVVSRADTLAADLPLATRCPVLAVDEGSAPAFPLGRVAVAWDGGASAAQALRASLPLLRTAGEVRVLTVESPAEAAEFPATDVAAYLARHDVGCELVPLAREGSVEATLAAALARQPADLLVLGAYAHGRLRSFLFGGVTGHFLGSPAAPALLLVH